MTFKRQMMDEFGTKEYQFHPNFLKNYDLRQEDAPKGRFYHVDGLKLQSVTTFLGKTQSEDKRKTLEDWKKRVGEEEANRITNEAADRGETLHNLCESYIKGEFTPPKFGTNSYALFKQIYPKLQKLDNIHALEKRLYSKKMLLAGTVDCIGEWDGELSVIDFKTTIKEKREEWITDYFLQATCYSIMYNELFGIPIKQIVILMVKDNSPLSEAQVFVKKPIDYMDQLIYRIRKFRKL